MSMIVFILTTGDHTVYEAVTDSSSQELQSTARPDSEAAMLLVQMQD